MLRPYVLYVSDRKAGTFTTKRGAEDEEERICRLAQRDGHAVTTRIEYVGPRTEEEADEARFHEQLP